MNKPETSDNMVPKSTTSETSPEELDPDVDGDVPKASGDADPGLPEDTGSEGEPPSAGGDQPPSTDPAEIEKELEAELGALMAEEGPSVDEELERVRTEMEEVRDRHLRLAAEFENYRKRVSADLAGSWARAQAELAGKLLDGLDDLQRVSQYTSEDTSVEAIIEGVDLVERKLVRAMAEAGLAPFEPVGEPFDPNKMEAMMRVPTEVDGQDETVSEVFQKGYTFKDLLIRPARVSVFKDDD